MNKITILAISAVFAVSMIAITAFEAEAKPPSSAICPAENVQHWLNFRLNNEVTLQHSTEPSIPPTALLIQLPFVGSELFNLIDRDQIAADRLNEMGYFVDDSGPRPVEASDVTLFFSVEPPYSTICAEN